MERLAAPIQWPIPWLLIRNVIASFLLLAVSLIISANLSSWKRLSAFPGPWLASLCYIPMFCIRLSGRSHHKYFKISKKYGPLVRIGPNDLLASDTSLVRAMSAVRSSYERSSWYRAIKLDPDQEMMGNVTDKRKHMSLRSMMAAGYSGRDIPSLEPDIEVQVQRLIHLIDREYLSGGSVKLVDFGRLADLYAYDSKFKLAFGEPLGLVEKNADIRSIIANVKMGLEWIQIFTDVPSLSGTFLLDVVLRVLGPKPTDIRGIGYLLGLAQELVCSRLGPKAHDKPDLLGSFLRHRLSRQSAQLEIMFPVFAGSDTTANAISDKSGVERRDLR